MSAEYFQILADKFIFTVKKGFLYTENETWVKIENERVRVGVTDFFQRRGGDVIYIELPQVGSTVMLSEEITQVESIKTVSELASGDPENNAIPSSPINTAADKDTIIQLIIIFLAVLKTFSLAAQ